MISVTDLLQGLSDRQLEQLKSSPTMREAFIADLSEEHGVDPAELHSELDNVLEFEEPAAIEIPMKVVTPQPVLDSGNNFRVKQKKAKLMNEILEVLMEGGMSKTDILKTLNKDNASWRAISRDVLNYLIARNMVVSLGRKYYLSKNNSFRESPFHRKVYAILCDGPKTTTALLNGVGYNNPKGRKKLEEVLSLMISERFVVKSGNKWELIV